MREVCECDEHGSSFATIVCEHIIDGLFGREARGFMWGVDDDGEYSAVCLKCEEMAFEEWDRRAVQLARVLCFECYCQAAAMNGVTIHRMN